MSVFFTLVEGQRVCARGGLGVHD